jgi:excisionase family DNA binding protein
LGNIVGEGLPQAAAQAHYLTPAEVAALLRVSKSAVYRLASDDPTMPVLRLGGSGRSDALGREPRATLRFPRERLLAWLRSREQGVASRSSKLTLSEVAR